MNRGNIIIFKKSTSALSPYLLDKMMSFEDISKINKIIAEAPPIASPVTIFIGMVFDSEPPAGENQRVIGIIDK